MGERKIPSKKFFFGTFTTIHCFSGTAHNLATNYTLLIIMLSSLIPSYDVVAFNEIHTASRFLPSDENYDSLYSIMYVMVCITILNLILLQAVKLWQRQKSITTATWKASYQITNLIVNLLLGCMGVYYQFNLPLDNVSTIDKIIGYENLKIFSLGQIGYQLWALTVGIIYVGETRPMIIHHVAVICVCTVSAFVRCGFRYYTPYFYGLIEISSVPLSVMNSFKNNKQWIKDYPDVYSAVRLIFGVTFLSVRVILWTPYYWSFFALCSMFTYSSDALTSKFILIVFLLASLVLTFLQIFWASKIVKALLFPPKKKDQSKKTGFYD